jgi:hypothetical protein
MRRNLPRHARMLARESPRQHKACKQHGCVMKVPEPRPQPVTQEPELRSQASTGIAQIDRRQVTPRLAPEDRKGARVRTRYPF